MTPQPINRRTVLKGTGAALAGYGLTGVGSASDCSDGSEDTNQVVFCGCSQVCWTVPYCSVVVVHTEEEWFAYTDGNVGLEPVGGDYETSYCYEVGDDVDMTVDGEKIIALEVFDTDGRGGGSSAWNKVYLIKNPNQCASRSLNSLDIEGRIDKGDLTVHTMYGDRPRDVPGGCGKPPGEHSGGKNKGNRKGKKKKKGKGNGNGSPKNRGSKGRDR